MLKASQNATPSLGCLLPYDSLKSFTSSHDLKASRKNKIKRSVLRFITGFLWWVGFFFFFFGIALSFLCIRVQ